MCSGKKTFEPSSPVKHVRGMTESAAPPDATSPYQYQLSKPKLSRNITPSVKINLNRYWSKFGEMVSPATRARSAVSLGRTFSEERTRETITRIEDVTEAGDGGSRAAQRRFELSGGLSEADENLINEIREICNTSMIYQYINCKCY